MRKGLLIVGGLIMVAVVPVLVFGFERLGALTNCENYGPCPSGLSPTDPGIVFLAEAARTQVIYGAVFCAVAGILLLFGIFGSAKSENRL